MPGLHQSAVKVCKVCGVEKHVAAFGRKGVGSARAAKCRDCLNARNREIWAGASEAKLRRKAKGYEYHLKSRYGLTLAAYDELLAKQHGACAICGRAASDGGRKLAVDHDHATDEVRGLLCRRCNRSMGGFDDSPTLLLEAAKYLSK
jgi:hypothetical protein